MTGKSKNKVQVTSRGFSLRKLGKKSVIGLKYIYNYPIVFCFSDPGENDLFKILKIFKRREKDTLPIHYRKNVSRSEPSLLKVEKDLFLGKYKNRNWSFIRDVNKFFDFIKSQHAKKSKSHRIASEVNKEKRIDLKY